MAGMPRLTCGAEAKEAREPARRAHGAIWGHAKCNAAE